MEHLSHEQLVEQLGNLTIPQIVALTKSLEEKWGVSATPQVSQQEFRDDNQQKLEVQTEFTVTLQAVSAAAKMATIKMVREYLGLPLKESKDFVESAPKLIKDGLTKAEADEAVAKFKEAGATVEVK